MMHAVDNAPHHCVCALAAWSLDPAQPRKHLPENMFVPLSQTSNIFQHECLRLVVLNLLDDEEHHATSKTIRSLM
jgi:hypothetical protein